MGPNLFFEKPEIIYLQPQEMAWHHHGSDKPTSTRAILHHTDPNAPNISGGSVPPPLAVTYDSLPSTQTAFARIFYPTRKPSHDNRVTILNCLRLNLFFRFHGWC